MGGMGVVGVEQVINGGGWVFWGIKQVINGGVGVVGAAQVINGGSVCYRGSNWLLLGGWVL